MIKQPSVIKSIKVFLSVEYCQNIRATQSKTDGNGMRYNPIEDLVKVAIFLLYIKLFWYIYIYIVVLHDQVIHAVESWSQLHIGWLQRLHLQIQGDYLRGTSVNSEAMLNVTDLQYFHILFLGVCVIQFSVFYYFIFNLWCSVVSFSVPQGQNVTAEADQNLEHLEYALHEIIKYTISPYKKYTLCHDHDKIFGLFPYEEKD